MHVFLHFWSLSRQYSAEQHLWMLNTNHGVPNEKYSRKHVYIVFFFVYVSLREDGKKTKIQLMSLDKRQYITCAYVLIIFFTDGINIVTTICKIYDIYLFIFISNDLLFWSSSLNYIELYF